MQKYDMWCHDAILIWYDMSWHSSHYIVVFGLFFWPLNRTTGTRCQVSQSSRRTCLTKTPWATWIRISQSQRASAKKAHSTTSMSIESEVKIIENHRNDKVRLVRSCSDLSRPSYLNRFNHCKWQFQRHLRAGLWNHCILFNLFSGSVIYKTVWKIWTKSTCISTHRFILAKGL